MDLLKKTAKPIVLTEKNIVSIFRKAQKKLKQQNLDMRNRYAFATKESVRASLALMGFSIKEAKKIIKKVWSQSQKQN